MKYRLDRTRVNFLEGSEMKYHFDGAARATERGILALVQRCFPTAHEVFFSCGDVMLCRNGEVVAYLPVSIRGAGTFISCRPRPMK